MNVPIAEAIILQTGIKVAFQHRFAFDTGTILRLENGAMLNIFDDGRYYLQGDNTEELTVVFGRVEAPWDPAQWDGEAPKPGLGQAPEVKVAKLPAVDQNERLDF